MAVTIILIVLAVLAGVVKSETAAPEFRECELLQYLTIGSNGTITCSFNEYLAISWYNPEAEEAIIFYKDGDKTGEGYTRGGYDVFPNGSLFIRNVSLEHEMLYRVTKIISLTQLSVSYEIRVQTVVKPNMTYPTIDKCPLGRRACLVSLKYDVALNCLIEKTRPSVDLNWVTRTLDRDQVLESEYLSVTQDNVTYTSRSTVMFSLKEISLLTLLVCEASSVPPFLIAHSESMVLVDRVINYTLEESPTTKYIALGSPLKLLCTGSKGLLLWKQMLAGQRSWSSIVYSIPPPNPATESYSSQFQLDSHFSLVWQNIDVQNEGRYVCIHNDGVDEEVTMYEVNVYVNPVPSYPAVDGCNHQQYCVLHVEPGDVLTCGVYGIRPEIKLQWRTFHDDTSVSFSDQTQTIQQRGYLYDVVLTSRLTITSAKDNRITMECRVTQSKNHQFDLSTTFDLLYVYVPTTSEPPTANVLIPIVIVSILVFITLFSAAAFLIIMIARRRRELTNVQCHSMEEATPMINVVNENSQQRYDESKEEELIKQLKRKYKILYEAVQPIPYIKDRMYCVDKVFVEGAIEYLNNITVAKQDNVWKQMNSYNELMDGTRINSTRKILEGEPGYGKSTLTLQLLYDWCHGVPESPLKQIKILILLRLRQLGGVNSIFEAVRRFILPGDSKFTDDDVKSVIENCSSVMLVLDGYDEYPDQDKTNSDVYKIIKNDIFREITVILTTRSSYLPNYLSSQTDRARLTGFDDLARDKYIRKAVTGDDNEEAVDEIKRKLQENPVLGDLCEVTLFFVMFAHITHEDQGLQTFSSVTAFFQYMISCFHSHLLNKMKDENVRPLTKFESNHSKLDKIAFNALSGKDQQIVWQKQKLCKALGEPFYKQYVKIGILVEEEVLDVFSMPDSGEMRSTVEVRFYHKLFCEWYAAHHLAKTILKRLSNTSALLANLDPFDLQYVYRFACGLDKAAARKIIKHLQKTNAGQKFAMLCILEQEGDKDELLDSVTELVSNVVTVNVNDSKLLQRSVTQILEFASKKEIPISCLYLKESFSKIAAGDVILHAGLRLSCPVSVKKVVLHTEEGREMTEPEVVDILMFVQQSHILEELKLNGCLLPLSFSLHSVHTRMRSRDVKVLWGSYGYRLNLQSGAWEVDDLDTVKKLCTGILKIRRNDSELLQRCTTKLLENASDYDIPISCLYLEESFNKIDAGDVILHSGLRLSCLKSVEKVVIHTRRGREMTETEFVDILMFVQQSQMLKELRFDGCLLPPILSSESIPTELKSRDIKVFWNEYGYSLNPQSGIWEVDVLDTVKRKCTGDVNIYRNDSELLQRCTIKLTENASYYKIPISCLYLDESFSKIDAGDVILHSGLRLSCPVSIKQVLIDTKEGTEMTEIEFVDILKFIQQSYMLKELWFEWCLLPQYIPTESIPSILKSRNVKVSWGLKYTKLYILNLQSGRWMHCGTRQEITDTEYNDTVRGFRENWKESEWQKARVASGKKCYKPSDAIAKA